MEMGMRCEAPRKKYRCVVIDHGYNAAVGLDSMTREQGEKQH